MKSFVLGFIFAVIIGVLILLVYVGIISLKIAILVPLCLVCGIAVGMLLMCWIFRPW